MVYFRGELKERIAAQLAILGPQSGHTIEGNNGYRTHGVGWPARKALGSLVKEGNVERQQDGSYKLLDKGALWLSNSLVHSGRYESLAMSNVRPKKPEHLAAMQASLLAGVISIGHSALNALSENGENGLWASSG